MSMRDEGRLAESLGPDLFVHTECKLLEETKADDGSPLRGKLEGYASTKDLDDVNDIVHPSAFIDTLPEFMENPNFFWMHNPADPLGLIAKAEIDENGLYVHPEVFLDTVSGRDRWAFMKGGVGLRLSIGYAIPEGGETFDPDAEAWHITKLKLREISAVTIPANRNAVVSISKQIRAWANGQREKGETRFKCLSNPRPRPKPIERGGHTANTAGQNAVKAAITAALVSAVEDATVTLEASRAATSAVLGAGTVPPKGD